MVTGLLTLVGLALGLVPRFAVARKDVAGPSSSPARTDQPFMVVGVTEDVRHRDLINDIRGGFDDPDVYFP